MAIKKGDLVRISGLENRSALVITDAYCSVFTTKDLDSLSSIDSNLLARTLLSSEVIVVDILFENNIYKKVPVSTLTRTR